MNRTIILAILLTMPVFAAVKPKPAQSKKLRLPVATALKFRNIEFKLQQLLNQYQTMQEQYKATAHKMSLTATKLNAELAAILKSEAERDHINIKDYNFDLNSLTFVAKSKPKSETKK